MTKEDELDMDTYLLHIIKYKELLDEYFDSDMDLDDLWNAYQKLKAKYE